MRTKLWLIGLALLAGSAGCTESDSAPSDGAEVPTPGEAIHASDPESPPEGQSEPAGDASADETTDAATPPAAEAGSVRLELRDWAGVEQLVAAHRGKLVVVDLWSTACPPCVQEFPNLVKLHQALSGEVACISVSLDYDGIPSQPVETYVPLVQKFLESQQATFENVLINTPPDEFYEQVQIGSIPAVFVYDAAGRLARKFTIGADGNHATYAGDIRPFVEGLLSGP